MTLVDRPRVFLDISIDGETAGRLVIELFVDHTPKTSENFRQLCTGEHDGLSYAESTIHRVIDEFMIQGGDIVNGDGTGVVSIYGQEFDDENLGWRQIDAAGLVCSANSGKNTNGSQFFITLDGQPHLDGKHTVFGRLLTGQDTIQRIARISVDDDDRPIQKVVISRCGELEKRKKRQQDAAQLNTRRTSSNDRGRSKQSYDNHETDRVHPAPPPTTARTRRQSDNIVDEGIRGRPRKRSETRRDSDAIEEDSAASSETSPVAMHKRKRSTSPSRHLEQTTGNGREGDYDRRRRSLPNRYRRSRDTYRRDDDRDHSRRYDERPRQHHGDRHYHRPESDRYRPQQRRHDSYRSRTDQRLDNYEDDSTAPAVKFKGRGVMKYREPGRL